jgi:pimeloyl-[acyl-carrier protein] methyl ester esterase
MNKKVIQQDNPAHYYFFIRGLIRSQFHWYQFPAIFEQVAQQQDAEVKAVLFDIPGNGERYQQATPFSIAAMADDISQQIQHYLTTHSISPDSKLHLVGISMGGMIAAALAEKNTINLASVHIINSSFANLSPFWQRMRLPAVINLLPNLWRTDKRERTILKWTSNKPSAIALAPKWAAEAKQHPLSLRNACAQLWAASHYFVGKKPALNSFVYCCQEDRLVSWKCSQRLALHWQVSLDCEQTAGHDLPLDNPNWLAEKILQRR